MTFLKFLLVGFLGGTTGALIKYAANELPPVFLIAIRFTLSILMLLVFVQIYKIKVVKGKWLLLGASSLFFAANNFLFTFGVKYTSAIMSQLIYVPTSLLVAILGYVFLKEKLRPNQIIGLVMTLFGMGVLIFGSIQTHDAKSFGEPIGNLLILIGLFTWAGYLLISRKLSTDHTPLTIAFINFATVMFASFALLPVEAQSANYSFSQISSGTYMALTVAAATSAAFIFLFQNFIKNTSAFIASLVVYINPIFGALWGMFLFGEKLNQGLVIGSAIVFVGVFMATSYNYLKDKVKSN